MPPRSTDARHCSNAPDDVTPLLTNPYILCLGHQIHGAPDGKKKSHERHDEWHVSISPSNHRSLRNLPQSNPQGYPQIDGLPSPAHRTILYRHRNRPL